MTDVSAFVDPAALGLLSAKSKTEAAGAQFNALQFGRVGAPRNWTGDNGQAGAVTVGPYVRVNLIDCRDFTHTVSVGGQNYVKKGTACREADGSWTVSA
jgi:surface antigen